MDPSTRSRARLWVARAKLAMKRDRPRRHLFVLSHMRSYSSLLCHILNSNPDITGYVELHRRYHNPSDLIDLQLQVAETTRGKLEGRYVLDKLLHNSADVSRRILRRDDVFTVFSIREPGPTIRSTIQMVQRKKNPDEDWKNDPTLVARYYVRRLERLVRLAQRTPRHALFFEAERLIDDTASVLDGLSRFLDLEQPLSDRYETFELTGRATFGDPGRFIASGEIVRDREIQEFPIPEDALAVATDAFERARDALRESCTVVGTAPGPGAAAPHRQEEKPSPGPR